MSKYFKQSPVRYFLPPEIETGMARMDDVGGAMLAKDIIQRLPIFQVSKPSIPEVPDWLIKAKIEPPKPIPRPTGVSFSQIPMERQQAIKHFSAQSKPTMPQTNVQIPMERQQVIRQLSAQPESTPSSLSKLQAEVNEYRSYLSNLPIEKRGEIVYDIFHRMSQKVGQISDAPRSLEELKLQAEKEALESFIIRESPYEKALRSLEQKMSKSRKYIEESLLKYVPKVDYTAATTIKPSQPATQPQQPATQPHFTVEPVFVTVPVGDQSYTMPTYTMPTTGESKAIEWLKENWLWIALGVFAVIAVVLIIRKRKKK